MCHFNLHVLPQGSQSKKRPALERLIAISDLTIGEFVEEARMDAWDQYLQLPAASPASYYEKGGGRRLLPAQTERLPT